MLVGYVVSKQGERAAESEELRRYLQERLPDYMIPGIFVRLEALPLTANGKVDRKALPAPERNDHSLRRYVKPRTPVEEMLCNIWAEVLEIETVGTADNFFELGGHSLLATQMISRVRDSLGVELPLRFSFEAPTVGELAQRLGPAPRERREEWARIEKLQRHGAPPLSYAQEGLWFLGQLEAGNVAYNIPFGIKISGRLCKPALRQCLDEIVRRHEILRSSFPAPNGIPLQLIADESQLEIEDIDLRGIDELQRNEEINRIAHKEVHEPFNLESGTAIRVKLAQLEDQEHILLITMHHIVSDGWSMGVMAREFTARRHFVWTQKRQNVSRR
jgi:acyl carrier protein